MIPGSDVLIDMSNLDTARNSYLTIFSLIADHLALQTEKDNQYGFSHSHSNGVIKSD